MTNKFNDPKNEVPEVVIFLYYVIKLIACWLDEFPKYLQSVKKKQRNIFDSISIWMQIQDCF